MSDKTEERREILVYCTYCNKTHAVTKDETPCYPGAWLDPAPILWPPSNQSVPE